MTSSNAGPPDGRPKYLCVDAFLRSMVGVQALKCAFDLGIVGRLTAGAATPFDDLVTALAGDRAGLRALCDLLAAEGVLQEDPSGLRVADAFAEALRYRDLLEAKVELANLVAPDLIDHFTLLINDPDQFMARARVFNLFDYQRACHRTESNYALTERWVRLTTALTRYEAGACVQHHDFGGYQTMLDVGGNSGEFALQLCRRNPSLSATVLDLPLVCDVGVEHLRGEPEADRIRFIPGDALRDPLPAGSDLITFKSMLHDWPEELAGRLLTRAAESLAPGGTLLIFERGPMRLHDRPLTYGLIPMLLFFRSFRSPSIYQRQLEGIGLSDVNIQDVNLEMPFHIVTAKKRR